MEAFSEYTFKSGMTLRNKIVMAPMTLYSSNEDLTLSLEEEHYYQERSKEVGMVITAAVAVSKNAQAFERQISAKSDFHHDSLVRLADSIKLNGARAIMQLHHGGRMNTPNLFIGQKIVAPSSIKGLRDNLEIPKELSSNEINTIIDDFKQATLRAIKAGFDGVEIHGANTYLIQQFYSPHSNQRTDSWGERLKFPIMLTDEIIKVVKKNSKTPFIIGYRFSPEEVENPGITIKDTVKLLKALCEKELDYLHVSLGEYNQTSIRDKDDSTITAEILLKAIKGKIPLIGVGGIDSGDKIKDALKLGYDLVAIGTGLIADQRLVSNINKTNKSNKIFDFDKLPYGLKTRMIKHEAYYKQKGYTFKKK